MPDDSASCCFSTLFFKKNFGKSNREHYKNLNKIEAGIGFQVKHVFGKLKTTLY